MGLITTLGKFCFIECDNINCNKKMEHIDQKLLKELAMLCGWKYAERRWLCPNCSETAKARQKKPSKSQKKAKAPRKNKSA